MRIFLKEAKQVGPVSYPAAGFYNVPDELGNEWVDSGLAQQATNDNRIIEVTAVGPTPVAAEPQPMDESEDR